MLGSVSLEATLQGGSRELSEQMLKSVLCITAASCMLRSELNLAMRLKEATN